MNITPHLTALQVIVPLLGAPLVALLRVKGLAWAAATSISVMAFAIAVNLVGGVLNGDNTPYLMGSWPAPYGIELSIDSFSAIILLIVTGASSLALLGGRVSIDCEIEDQRQPLFYGAWLLALAGLVGIVVTADAFNIFVFMEISSLASYVLIAGGPNRQALPSVFKYLVMGTVGATFYLIGVGMIYMMTGTLNLADMAVRISDVTDTTPVLVAAGFITVGLALKAAVFPLHAWLPNAYTFAPNVVTVFLAACATKVALYVLIRFDFLVFQANLSDHSIQFSSFLLPLSVLAIVIASGYAMFQQNLKKILAYSSVAQIGYIVNHALAKGALFLAVAGLATRLSSLQLDDLAGAAKAMPWTMAAFVGAGLSLIGVPGTAGFISKWFLITAVLQKGAIGVILVVVIVLSSLMAVVYIWRVIEAAYFKTPKQDGVISETEAVNKTVKEAPFELLVMVWAAVAANVYFGLNSQLTSSLASNAAELLIGGTK